MSHLPVLPVLILLLAAPLCLIINRASVAWLMTVSASIVALVCAWQILAQVLASGPLTYALDGWEAPFGIEYRIDLLSAWMLLIISLIGSLVAVFSRQSVKYEIEPSRQVYFYIAYLLCFGALMGVVSSGDIFHIFVMLEISALSSYTLIAMGRNKLALWASFQYLILGTIGATFILIGIGLIYAMTGTLNIADIAERLEAVGQTRTVITAFVFLILGTLLKLALFPLHLWLPNAYTYAPSAASAFLAATATKVALYLLIRLTYTVFGTDFLPMSTILVTLGMFAAVAGSLIAISQSSLKRMFAYSSVAQIGYLVLGLGMSSQTGLTSTLIHTFNHALMKGALFMSLGAVVYRLGDATFKELAGLGQRMPLTMAAIAIACASLLGLPGTAGFISKWYLVSAAIENDWLMLAGAILISSVATAVYVWRVIDAGYFQTAVKVERVEAPVTMLAPMLLLAFANIYFGLDTSFMLMVVDGITNSLMGVGQ
jgi:multicomponent Na+:H+ antiporter subunit D